MRNSKAKYNRTIFAPMKALSRNGRLSPHMKSSRFAGDQCSIPINPRYLGNDNPTEKKQNGIMTMKFIKV